MQAAFVWRFVRMFGELRTAVSRWLPGRRDPAGGRGRGARPCSPSPPAASRFAHRPLGKKLHEKKKNAKTGIFCNIMKDNLILAHSVTCATPKKAILNGSFYFQFLYCVLNFCLFFFLVLHSESAVCMLSYIFIFQRALNLSTKRKLNKQTNKKKDSV